MKTILIPALLTAISSLPHAATAQGGFEFSSSGGKYSLGARDSIPPVVVQFTAAERGKVEILEEDLSVMTRLIEKNLERGLGEEAVPYKMNIPLLVTSSGRSVRAMYAEGIGALFMIKLNLPLIGPSRADAKKADASDSEWDRIRKEMQGEEEAAALTGTPANSDFDESHVESLKTLLLQTLKHASNIRSLRPDEFVAVSVFGSESGSGVAVTPGNSSKSSSKRKGTVSPSATSTDPGQPTKDAPNSVTVVPALNATVAATPAAAPAGGAKGGSAAEPASAGFSQNYYLEASRRGYSRGTVMTLRVKKSDVDAFAKGELNLDGFKKRATLNAYNGNGYGVTSLNSWIQSGRPKATLR
jgi:hypothetical protein